MAIAPDPLVPAEVDLRGLEYMPFFGNHLFGSEFNARCTDGEWRAGVTLWWAAWNQVPAGSLPNDDTALARLADLGRDVKGWRKVKARALHGFIECSDGRLYHRFLSKQALVAWDKRVKEREKKRKWREGHDRSGDRDNAAKGPGHGGGHDPGQSGSEHRDKAGDGTADVNRRDVTGRDGTELQGRTPLAPPDESVGAGVPVNGRRKNGHAKPFQDGPMVIVIPLLGGKDYEVHQSLVDHLDRSYPAVDAMQTLREVRSWNLLNERERKTEAGILRHINRWFAKEQNRG